MSEPITNALTAEEWAGGLSPEGHMTRRPIPINLAVTVFATGERMLSVGFTNHVMADKDAHGLAALCLYGQPFGFTQEDVEELRVALALLEHTGATDGLRELASRIAALLPPPDRGRFAFSKLPLPEDQIEYQREKEARITPLPPPTEKP